VHDCVIIMFVWRTPDVSRRRRATVAWGKMPTPKARRRSDGWQNSLAGSFAG
jgi:hypothetical protein